MCLTKARLQRYTPLIAPCIYVDVDDEIWGTLEDDDELSSIPLTKEMLEKNGWQWDEDDWVFFCEFCPHVYLAPSSNGFNVVDATGEQLGRINTATHELQHLLWALGMDDDLKI